MLQTCSPSLRGGRNHSNWGISMDARNSIRQNLEALPCLLLPYRASIDIDRKCPFSGSFPYLYLQWISKGTVAGQGSAAETRHSSIDLACLPRVSPQDTWPPSSVSTFQVGGATAAGMKMLDLTVHPRAYLGTLLVRVHTEQHRPIAIPDRLELNRLLS